MVSENRIVVKVGSSLLVNEELLTPSYAFMHGLLGDIAALRAEGKEVVLTSSGSVALGLGLLGADPATAGVQEKQAAAACGQPILLNAYKQIALEYGFDVLEINKNSINKNDRVMVIDDLIATGGTAVATSKLISKSSSKKIEFIFVIELEDLPGVAKIKKLGHAVTALCSFKEEEK